MLLTRSGVDEFRKSWFLEFIEFLIVVKSSTVWSQFPWHLNVHESRCHCSINKKYSLNKYLIFHVSQIDAQIFKRWYALLNYISHVLTFNALHV